MNETTIAHVFHFDKAEQTFEDYSQQNTITYWYARQFMEMLGYQDFKAFQHAINRAIAACTALNIPVLDNFIQCQREIDGKEYPDYKLSRFACYLVSMNGDVRKPQVAAAQAYFATLAESFRQYIQEGENVERVAIREDISEREKTLHSTVKKAGVENYAFFQNAGYRGMYNLHISQLRTLRGTPDRRSPLDFMGKDEMAANLFRLTQTELKIKQEGIKGQLPLEATAETVGKTVRKAMMDISGIPPEQLPAAEDIHQVQKALKKTHKEFKKLDSIKDEDA